MGVAAAVVVAVPTQITAAAAMAGRAPHGEAPTGTGTPAAQPVTTQQSDEHRATALNDGSARATSSTRR